MHWDDRLVKSFCRIYTVGSSNYGRTIDEKITVFKKEVENGDWDILNQITIGKEKQMESNMDQRTFINQRDILGDKAYQKMPIRSSFPKEVFEVEEKFGIKVVGIIFQKKESGSPDFTVDFIVDENKGGNSEK